jgi:hypothetical protein
VLDEALTDEEVAYLEAVASEVQQRLREFRTEDAAPGAAAAPAQRSWAGWAASWLGIGGGGGKTEV